MYRKPSRRDKSPRGVRFEHSGYRIQSRIEWIENPNDILNVWSNKAKINADEESFLEGILLKSLDIDSKFNSRALMPLCPITGYRNLQ